MGRLQTLDLGTRPEPHGGLELSHVALRPHQSAGCRGIQSYYWRTQHNFFWMKQGTAAFSICNAFRFICTMSMWHMDRLKTVSRPFRIYWELPFQCSMLIASFNVTTGWGACSFCHSGLRPFLQRLPIKDQTVHGSLELLHRRKPCTCLTWVLWGAAPLPDEMRWWDRQHVEPLSCRDKSLDTLASRKPALRTRGLAFVTSGTWGRWLEESCRMWSASATGPTAARSARKRDRHWSHLLALINMINLELFHVDFPWGLRKQNLLASVCSSLRYVAWMFSSVTDISNI